MSLEQQLEEAKAPFVANTPIEIQMEMFRNIREQQQSGLASGLTEGSRAVDFTLKNTHAQDITLYEELTKGPVVLTLYRGGWCPFCNVQLRAYQHILPNIRALGGQLIAVSPQSPDKSISHKEKAKLDFQILSDTNGVVASKYNVLYEVAPYIQDIMQNSFNLNLAEYNATDRWILPVPSTFIIDSHADIRYTYVNPDFMKRLDPKIILDQLRKL